MGYQQKKVPWWEWVYWGRHTLLLEGVTNIEDFNSKSKTRLKSNFFGRNYPDILFLFLYNMHHVTVIDSQSLKYLVLNIKILNINI